MFEIKPLKMDKKGQAMTKVIAGTIIGFMVLIFSIFAVMFGISALNPASFFTAGSSDANATTNLQQNLTTGISSFGARIPTVLLVLGIVLVLTALVLLIYYVKQMEGAGGGGSGTGL